ncbi:MAG: hypothetical protein HZA46_12885 [Planctomycetales bacterium]|nr:hypothetical protein [Planctomycetales bacterium]
MSYQLGSFRRWLGIGTYVVCLLTSGLLPAEVHWQRARVRCSVPGYRYEADEPSTTVSVRTKVFQSEDFSRPPEKMGDKIRSVKSKRFLLNRDVVENQEIKLSQVGLRIYEDGGIAASGTLTHTGGADGSILRNCVTVRLRAYAGPKDKSDDGRDQIDGPILCEWSQTVLIRRGEPVAIQLPLPTQCMKRQIEQHFSEIVQLELDLIVRNNR